MASTSEPLAMGSCTCVISCHAVVPVDLEASIVVAGTAFTPSATSLIAAGAA